MSANKIYRPRVSIPTEDGWYYGEQMGLTHRAGLVIKPRYVEEGYVGQVPVDEFYWYGPVDTCERSNV